MASSGKQVLVGRRETTSLKAPAGEAKAVAAIEHCTQDIRLWDVSRQVTHERFE